MQRAERILLVALGILAAGWFDASPHTAGYVAPTLGGALAICGALAMWTAIGRGIVFNFFSSAATVWPISSSNPVPTFPTYFRPSASWPVNVKNLPVS
jgi:hypothetical protein